jgi:hypothetical protein
MPSPRSSSHAPSSSSDGEWEFEFIVILNGGVQRPLDKFAEFIADNESAALSLGG